MPSGWCFFSSDWRLPRHRKIYVHSSEGTINFYYAIVGECLTSNKVGVTVKKTLVTHGNNTKKYSRRRRRPEGAPSTVLVYVSYYGTSDWNQHQITLFPFKKKLSLKPNSTPKKRKRGLMGYRWHSVSRMNIQNLRSAWRTAHSHHQRRSIPIVFATVAC